MGALQELNHLKVFRLSWKSTLQSRELIELSTSFRQLTKLNLSGCKFLDDDSLQRLAHLPLTIIKLLDVPNITDRGYDVILQLPRLVKLVTGWTMDDELTDAPPLPQQLGRRSSSLASLFVRPPRTDSNEDSFSAMTSPTSSFMSPSSVHVPPLSLSSSVHELPTRLSFSGNSLSNDSIHLVPGSTGFLLATATTAITSLSSSDELSTPSSTASSRRSSNLGLQGWRSRSHQLHDITEEPLLSPNDNGPGLATPHSPLRLTFIEGLAKPGAPHLQILRLHHHGNKDLLNRSVAIAAISQLSSLRELHLCAWGVTDEDAVHLARLTDLDTLVLSQSDLTSKGAVLIFIIIIIFYLLCHYPGLKVLGDRLRSLYRLDLRLSNRLVCRNGEGLSYFGGPHRVLHSVCLAGCEALDPTALRAFVHMPNLHVLDLSMTRVRPFDLLHLVGISTLRKLSLSACKHIVAVQALRVLHDAQHLHSIDMLGCPFDVKSVELFIYLFIYLLFFWGGAGNRSHAQTTPRARPWPSTSGTTCAGPLSRCWSKPSPTPAAPSSSARTFNTTKPIHHHDMYTLHFSSLERPFDRELVCRLVALVARMALDMRPLDGRSPLGQQGVDSLPQVAVLDVPKVVAHPPWHPLGHGLDDVHGIGADLEGTVLLAQFEGLDGGLVRQQ